MKLIINFYLILLTLFFCSCKGFLEIDPPKDRAKTEQMFTNDIIATSAITGIYSRMSSNLTFSGGLNSIAVIGGLSSDELKSYNPTLNDLYRNEVTGSNTLTSSLWTDAYAYIYTCNSILEGLNLENGVTPNTRKQLQGEAKFIRAFCYFYLVNLFGDVPLNLITDYRISGVAGKLPKEKIYAQIITDLIDAEDLLSDVYITTERIRPNKWAAKATLSRVYLYTGKWDLAAQKASEVIDQKATYEMGENLDQVFLKNSKEAIWQIMPTAGSNTNEGALFNLITTPTNVSLSPDFIPQFETGDNRRAKWIGEYSNVTGKYYYPFKYKIRTTTATTGIVEYSMVMRLAELHLIRAEARINSDEIPLGIADLNLLRKRARALPTITVPNPLPELALTLSKADALLAVERERRIELFSEWGHRWLDLKRTGRATTVLTPIKGATWQNTDVLYPIPDVETTRNPNLR